MYLIKEYQKAITGFNTHNHPPTTPPPKHTTPPATQEPILIPKLRIHFADFPYHTFFYQLEALHLGDLMRFAGRPQHFFLNGNTIFTGLDVTTRTELQQSHLFSHTSHFLCIMQFQWLHAIKKKSKFWKSKTLPESRPVVSCYHVLPHYPQMLRFWNINPNSLSEVCSISRANLI